MGKVSDVYDVSGITGNIRGKAAQGFIRPTIMEFFTSTRFAEVSSYVDPYINLAFGTGTVFKTGYADGLSATPLNTGGFMLLYGNMDDGSLITFSTYGSDGTEVTGPTRLSNEYNVSNGLDSTTLPNGNVFFIMHSAGVYISIISPTGTEVLGFTKISNSNVEDTSITLLDNGNVAVCWETSTGDLQLAVYTNTGGQVVAPTTFKTGVNAFHINMTTIDGGFLIAWSDSNDGNDSAYAKFNNNGTVMQAASKYTDTGTTYIQAPCVLDNDNLVLYYTYSSFPTVYILNSVGGVVKDKTQVGITTGGGSIASCALPNGGFLVTHHKPGDTRYLTFDKDGNELTATTQLIAADTAALRAITLSNGNVVIAYTTNTNCMFSIASV